MDLTFGPHCVKKRPFKIVFKKKKPNVRYLKKAFCLLGFKKNVHPNSKSPTLSSSCFSIQRERRREMVSGRSFRHRTSLVSRMGGLLTRPRPSSSRVLGRLQPSRNHQRGGCRRRPLRLKVVCFERLVVYEQCHRHRRQRRNRVLRRLGIPGQCLDIAGSRRRERSNLDWIPHRPMSSSQRI